MRGKNKIEKEFAPDIQKRAKDTQFYYGLQPSFPNLKPYSHSIVDGGFWLMSYTTRLTPLTSLMMRDEMFPRTS